MREMESENKSVGVDHAVGGDASHNGCITENEVTRSTVSSGQWMQIMRKQAH
jgi:hypothetical protein